MSSLQKFHRRTQVSMMVVAPILGSGSNTKGYYLGLAGDGTTFMYVAPKSTEVQRVWGSYNTQRGTTSTTNGLDNTNTLYAFGSAAHPAAYYCKTLTTGGYNTWYLPAKDEINTLYSNKSATPFSSSDAFQTSYYVSSTEQYVSNYYAVVIQRFNDGLQGFDYTRTSIVNQYVRAVRGSLI